MFALQLTPMPHANYHGRRLKLLEDIFPSSHHVSIPDDELMRSTVQASTISEYDLGAEWDLVKVPELLVEDPTLELDITADVISVLSPGYATTETIKAADTEAIRFKEDHLIDIFYERKDLLEKSETENSISQLSDANAAIAQMDEVVALEELTEGSMQRSASSGCLRALERFPNCTLGLDVLDFQRFDVETAFGLRRAFSEGDIQYACRKVLAENQPRVRGRFAKV